MKTINVTELKAHLSQYLREASRGSRIVVHDRNEPVAELGPLQSGGGQWRERLHGEGRLRRGTQAWGELRISPLVGGVDIQASLRHVRDDPRDSRDSR
jgi:prevent-host-death family protein